MPKWAAVISPWGGRSPRESWTRGSEFRNHTNGIRPLDETGLLRRCTGHDKLPAIDAAEKKGMRDLGLRGGPWTAREGPKSSTIARVTLGLQRLSPAMPPAYIDLPCAVACRGRDTARRGPHGACGRPDRRPHPHPGQRGVGRHQVGLIEKVDADFGVYEGTTFKRDRFAGTWHDAASPAIPWGKSGNGMDTDTFRDMSKVYTTFDTFI